MAYYIAETKDKDFPTVLLKLTEQQKNILEEEQNKTSSHFSVFHAIGVNIELYADNITKITPADNLYKEMNRKVSRVTTCTTCHLPVMITKTKEHYCPKCHKIIDNNDIGNYAITPNTIEATIGCIIADQKIKE